MTRKRNTEEQIIAVLKDAQAGVSVQALCLKHGLSNVTFYNVLPRLNCRQFIEDWERSILQRIWPSSIVPFSKDIRVHSLVTLLRGVRLSSAPMGIE